MGIHANSTCVMNYDGATGWLVGEEMKGLAAMFIMMNAARLGVGLQGLGVAETAYQNAVQYAHDRRQGRALTGAKEPKEKADTLFVHPDVRRMLMDAKAWTEGLRALCLWGALQVDLEHAARDRGGAAARRRPDRAADAGHQGRTAPTRATRSRPTRSRSMAATATSPNGGWSNMSAMRGSR